LMTQKTLERLAEDLKFLDGDYNQYNVKGMPVERLRHHIYKGESLSSCFH